MYESDSRSHAPRLAAFLLLALFLCAAVPTVDDIPALNDDTNCPRRRKRVEKIRRIVPKLERRRERLDEVLLRRIARLDRALEKWGVCLDHSLEELPRYCRKGDTIPDKLIKKKIAAEEKTDKKKRRIDVLITTLVTDGIWIVENVNKGVHCTGDN